MRVKAPSRHDVWEIRRRLVIDVERRNTEMEVKVIEVEAVWERCERWTYTKNLVVEPSDEVK